MSDSHEDLEALMESARSSHVEDDGFTSRVMAKLPEARRPVRRGPILLGAVAMGCGVAIASPARPYLFRLCTELDSSAHALTAAILLACVIVSVFGASLSTAFAD
jgi:hypothetical protein